MSAIDIYEDHRAGMLCFSRWASRRQRTDFVRLQCWRLLRILTRHAGPKAASSQVSEGRALPPHGESSMGQSLGFNTLLVPSEHYLTLKPNLFCLIVNGSSGLLWLQGNEWC